MNKIGVNLSVFFNKILNYQIASHLGFMLIGRFVTDETCVPAKPKSGQNFECFLFYGQFCQYHWANWPSDLETS